MDQMACSLANPGEALFLDTRNLEYRRITIPKELDLIVINSGIVHKNVGNEYNLRRSQCESVCQKLNLEFLRELGLDDLSKLNGLDEILIKRARHVVTENDRVLKAVSALENSDFMQLGKLFNESHESMKNDYEVSTAGIDHLVKIAQKTNGVFGARMTGGGFGGSIVAISKKGTGSTLAKLIAMEFASSSDYKPTVLVS
jgi:galactokinase